MDEKEFMELTGKLDEHEKRALLAFIQGMKKKAGEEAGEANTGEADTKSATDKLERAFRGLDHVLINLEGFLFTLNLLHDARQDEGYTLSIKTHTRKGNGWSNEEKHDAMFFVDRFYMYSDAQGIILESIASQIRQLSDYIDVGLEGLKATKERRREAS